jgi:phage-related protein
VASKYLRAIAERRLKDGEVEFDRVRQRKELEDQKIKKKFKEEIKKHSINELHADYDRGFFSALLDYFTITEQRKSSRRSK